MLSSGFASSCLLSFPSPHAFSSGHIIHSSFFYNYSLYCFIYFYHIIPLIIFSHASFVFLCFSNNNHSSSLCNTSHGVVVKRLSSKSLTNCMLFHPHALDNVTYMLNGVRCPLNGVPMPTHKCSII